MLVYLPACTKKQAVFCNKDTQVAQTIDNTVMIDDAIIQQESMLIDIPLPLYDERIVTVLEPSIIASNSVLGYKSPLTVEEATSFFMDHMERYGWKHLVTFQGPEIILQFKSPGRYCTFVINHIIDERRCSIFIYSKNIRSD